MSSPSSFPTSEQLLSTTISSSKGESHTVLITGGCGCIAQHLTRELLLNNQELNIDNIILVDIQPEWIPFWHVYDESKGGVDENDSSSDENIWKYPSLELEKEKIKFFQLDITNESKLNEFFENITKEYNLTTIFHVMSAILLWSSDMSILEKLNVQVTNQLLDLSFKYEKIKNFIYTSSGNVYYKTFSTNENFTSEDEFQTIERNEIGNVVNAKIEFPNNVPNTVEYNYVITKRKAHKLVVERPFKEKKALNSIVLTLCMTIYGENDQNTQNLIESNRSNLFIAAKGHSLYAGNAAHAHVLAFKSLLNNPNIVRGMTFSVHESNFGQLYFKALRGIMKSLTNDHEKYSETNTQKIPLFIMYSICYIFIFYNFLIYLLNLVLPFKFMQKLYFAPLITKFVIDVTNLPRHDDFDLKSIEKYLNYKPKYSSEHAYNRIALYLKKLHKLGKIKLPNNLNIN